MSDNSFIRPVTWTDTIVYSARIIGLLLINVGGFRWGPGWKDFHCVNIRSIQRERERYNLRTVTHILNETLLQNRKLCQEHKQCLVKIEAEYESIQQTIHTTMRNHFNKRKLLMQQRGNLSLTFTYDQAQGWLAPIEASWIERARVLHIQRQVKHRVVATLTNMSDSMHQNLLECSSMLAYVDIAFHMNSVTEKISKIKEVTVPEIIRNMESTVKNFTSSMENLKSSASVSRDKIETAIDSVNANQDEFVEEFFSNMCIEQQDSQTARLLDVHPMLV